MDSWDLSLTAENKSPTTIASYLRWARLYVEWCEGNGHPVEITRAQVQTYTAELIRDGKEANTGQLRQASCFHPHPLKSGGGLRHFHDDCVLLAAIKPKMVPTKTPIKAIPMPWMAHPKTPPAMPKTIPRAYFCWFLSV